MIEDRRFYVYGFFRPSGAIYYIGKGCGYRIRTIAKWRRNPYLSNIIKKCGEPIAVKIREGLTEAEAFETEIALIKAIGRADLGQGPLANMTDGGEGHSGMRLSPEARARLSASLKGRKASPELRAKLSAAKKGIKWSPEALANRRAALLEGHALRRAKKAALTKSPEFRHSL